MIPYKTEESADIAMNSTQKNTSILFQVIRAELEQTPFDTAILDTMDEKKCEGLLQLAAGHDLAHFIGKIWNGKTENPALCEIQRSFQQTYLYVLTRYVRLQYTQEQVFEALDQAKIPYMPLKGAVIRPLFPEPAMRTSCDIDILVKPEDLESARSVLTDTLGYRFDQEGQHDLSLYSLNETHIELHFRLIGDDLTGIIDQPLLDVWQYAMPAQEGTCRYVLPEEVSYYYHIAHMAKHMMVGGCGIRPLIDTYLLNRKISFDREKRDKILQSGGLVTFARQMEALSAVWFEGAPHTPITEQLEDYIVHGGNFGSTSNKIAIMQTKLGSKGAYTRSRIWLKFDELRFQYPVIEKHRYLIPVCQVRRWFRLVFLTDHTRQKEEVRATAAMTEDRRTEIVSMLKDLELM